MEKQRAKRIREQIDIICTDALKKNVFSACSVGYLALSGQDSEGDIRHYGRAGQGCCPVAVDDKTFFDLASLTKPLVTSLSLLALLQEEKIQIDAHLDQFFPIRGKKNSLITLRELLTHCAGLPAHRPYYSMLESIQGPRRMDTVIGWILDEDLIYEPGTANIYSDLGFILLGRIIEIVSGLSLEEYWRQKIVMPLQLAEDLHFPARLQSDKGIYATTGQCSWSKERLYGKVHDDNCRALGGVAGHAGLFGTLRAVLRLCENLVLQFYNRGFHPSYSAEKLSWALAIRSGGWRFGFDTPSPTLSSSGRYFSDMTIGHLGFTGTSFWIDLQREIVIVLLTNRVCCGDDLGPIKRLRPLVHDTIMAELTKKNG